MTDQNRMFLAIDLVDVEFLDNYARTQGYDSRSAVVHKAVGLLRGGELTEAYEQAWGS